MGYHPKWMRIWNLRSGNEIIHNMMVVAIWLEHANLHLLFELNLHFMQAPWMVSFVLQRNNRILSSTLKALKSNAISYICTHPYSTKSLSIWQRMKGDKFQYYINGKTCLNWLQYFSLDTWSLNTSIPYSFLKTLVGQSYNVRYALGFIVTMPPYHYRWFLRLGCSCCKFQYKMRSEGWAP